ncbi:MAG: GAF domain-containing sensor histidine kinase [Anaerolineae bacterium]|nr:GAF domain-containing sensor histidine kinase [Anaerolineae bacterium]
MSAKPLPEAASSVFRGWSRTTHDQGAVINLPPLRFFTIFCSQKTITACIPAPECGEQIIMTGNPPAADEYRIPHYIAITEKLKRGEYDISSQIQGLGQLGQALYELAKALEHRYREFQYLDRITANLNAGLLLDEVLENVYNDFRELIPYDRIGFALLEDNDTMLRACWAKTNASDIKLTIGYAASMAGSSLETIMRTGQPRILNDLRAYLRDKPQSESTRLIVEEGYQSSLTCPLVANNMPVGFMFFSSLLPNTYTDVHVDMFQRIAGQLSVIVEKGRLVSELAAQKQALEEKNDELIRLNDLKNTFVGMAAHDLRSPLGMVQVALSFVSGHADMLSEGEQQEMIEEAYRQSRYMLQLIDDLLDVTRIESGKLELKPEPITLPDFLQDITARHNKLAASKNTHVTLKPPPGGTITADPVRLRQVLDNLISNAVNFSPSSSQVTVWLDRLPDGWRFNVQDEGPGIRPEDREKLFQDFARLSARPTGGEKSTGLGLAISRRMIEAHGGHIDVESGPGQGATFWFTLPA